MFTRIDLVLYFDYIFQNNVMGISFYVGYTYIYVRLSESVEYNSAY